MRYTLLATTLALAGCQHPEDAARAAPSTPVQSPVAPAPEASPRAASEDSMVSKAPAKLDWSMALAPDGKSILVKYTLTNLLDRRIYAQDLMPLPGTKTFRYDPDFFIVTNGPEAGVVSLVRGRVRSEAPVAILIDPGGRAVDPGQSVEGSGKIPLPLVGAHYQGTVAPLTGNPTRAQLEICVLTGDVHWTYLQLDDGKNLTVSSPIDPIETVVGSVLPLPVR